MTSFPVSQGDDGEVGPRGLPGESVSSYLLQYPSMLSYPLLSSIS